MRLALLLLTFVLATACQASSGAAGADVAGDASPDAAIPPDAVDKELAGDADRASVPAASQTLLVAFYRRHLLGEVGLQAWLTGADVPAGVTVTHSP